MDRVGRSPASGAGVIDETWRRLTAGVNGENTVLLDGFHAVKHALRFGAELPLIITADRDGMLALAESLAPDLVDVLDHRAVQTDAATLSRLTRTSHHTKVAALAQRPTYDLASVSRTAPLVLLDNPRHLGNLGAVIRVAAGLGAAGVVATGAVDPWHPDAVRGSAGLHFALPTVRLDRLDALDRPLLAMDPAGTDARKLSIPDDAVLAFGSERQGLSVTVRQRADATVSIPMRAGISSYNLATSVAMMLYHWTVAR